MPLRFLPDWFVQLCYLTPFPHMINTSVEIYLGLLSAEEMTLALSAQVVWIVILVIASQIVLRAGVRRLVIQGG
jgi:ABC-2 type transport system permease protein